MSFFLYVSMGIGVGVFSFLYGVGEKPDRLKIVQDALYLQGTPYKYGGRTPSEGFDCSGFTAYVYQLSDIHLPRTTSAQFKFTIPVREPRPGDLVFFATENQGPSHSGIYLGERKFIHAPSSGGSVRIDSMDSTYWKTRFIGARTWKEDEQALRRMDTRTKHR